MLVPLRLECIGDDAVQRFRRIAPGMFKSPWVARILDLSSCHGFEREFLRGQKDYTHANSVGSRGVYLTFWLEEGEVYEVYAHLSWQCSERYFVLATGGELRRVSREQVIEWLSAPSE
jgi:hypothetical protein